MPFTYLIIGLFIFILLNFERYLYFLDTHPMLDIWFASIFSVCILPFYLLHGVFYDSNFFFQNHKVTMCQIFMSWNICLVLSTRIFFLDIENFLLFFLKLLILHFILKAMIHLEFIFVKICNLGQDVFVNSFFPVNSELFQLHLMKSLSFF